MPRKLRQPKLRAARVPQCVLMYLLTGDVEADAALLAELLPSLDLEVDEGENVWLAFTLCRDDSKDLADWWTALREPLMTAWLKAFPGSRPAGWWLFDAPRWRRTDLPERVQGLGDGPLSRFAEPRRRLGGVGDPVFEFLNFYPAFRFGVPVHFVDPRDVEYYNGRVRDVHGNRIGLTYHEGHFAGLAPRADDPPTFESEAAYLERHGLLSAVERRRLAADAFAPEVLAIDLDDDGVNPRAEYQDVFDGPSFDDTREVYDAAIARTLLEDDTRNDD